MAKYDDITDLSVFKLIRSELDRQEKETLSENATPNVSAIRRQSEEILTSGYRQAFSIDTDRIMHSRAYARYIDKTQVFYLIQNDHITHRVLHVQLVSKIARTIGRFLGLNQDLIEAVALGHDIGHTPFGHDGERFLSALCQKHGIGAFLHNVQSIQFLDHVERQGRGWNLCLQTLDGILSHDGEIHDQTLKPATDKRFGDLTREIHEKKVTPSLNLVPMTLEGCVVRMSDTISYIGRDLEDAIRLGVLDRTEIPVEVTDVLGNTNGTIVYNLVTDVIVNSYRKDHVAFSPEVSTAVKKLKQFNLDRIYMNPFIKKHTNIIEELFRDLFHKYMSDLEHQKQESVIFRNFLANKSEGYRQRHSSAEIVRDFIAGMTDQYFLHQFPEDQRPLPTMR
ncbi:MAG: HD domain-containing protein [Desulfobacteraceae bacterium]|nr:HD domain-containing protein [Desulfobacteraceae bacterium]